MSTHEPTDGGTPQDPAKERFTSPVEEELADKYKELEELDITGPGNEHPEGVIDISDYPKEQEDEPDAKPAVKDASGSEVKIMTPAERERLRQEDPEAYRRLTEEERRTDKDYWR